MREKETAMESAQGAIFQSWSRLLDEGENCAVSSLLGQEGGNLRTWIILGPGRDWEWVWGVGR